ncbi:MAG: glycosyltransferase family 4 protein [Candidatus Andersenbacteria bacterium]|nr:glycosyltransferase family 4 protein [Candidatus Andersenbacteria bacterium]
MHTTSPTPMRILILAPTPFFADRGCHMHIAEQAFALQRQGHAVHIVTYHLGRDLAGLTMTRSFPIPWYKKLGPGPSWHKFYVDPLLLITAWRVAKNFKPDVIHAHLHEGAVLGWILKKILGLPMVFDMQGSLTGELIAHRFPLVKTAWLRSIWYALERVIDHLAEAVLVQSTEMHDELLHQFKVPASKIFMAYDGVSTQVFTPGQRDGELMKKLAIPPGKKIIVYLGGLSPHKGVDILLEAFPQVLREVPHAFLLLMGYPNEEAYRRTAAAMGLMAHVRVTGRVLYEDAPRYLRLGDIAVAPKRSQTEANGKIYNYMAAGLPTIAFDTIMNREILGDLGIYVQDLTNPDNLARAMVKLLQEDNMRHQLAESVRAKAVRDYSWDAVATRITRAYDRVIGH